MCSILSLAYVRVCVSFFICMSLVLGLLLLRGDVKEEERGEERVAGERRVVEE